MATGYNVTVTRDEVVGSPTEGDVTALDIESYIDGTPSKPRGLETVFVDSDLFENPEITSGLDIDIVIADDAAQTAIDDEFDTINTDNLAEFLLTFGSVEDVLANGSAGNETVTDNLIILNQMMANPGQYSGAGFKAWKTTTSFTISDALDTANKIRNFGFEVYDTYLTAFSADRDAFLGV